LFGCFLAVSIANALAGAQSCTCFGEFEVKPWFALILDGAALSALWIWRPVSSDNDRGALLVVTIAVGCIALIAALAWLLTAAQVAQLLLP